MPATTNPLGVKGTGEAGTTGGDRGGDECDFERRSERRGRLTMEMPATPSKVWEAVQKGMAAD